MKLREKFRRFWTMDVHNHEGFTLVELIIVIAILAILSGVAVVGYSSYVEKANKQADVTLVTEIKNALNLAMYSDPFTNPTVGVLVLGTGGVKMIVEDQQVEIPEGSELDKVLSAAFGNYKETLKLKYADWEVATYLNGMNAGSATIVKDSSYLSGNRADKLLSDVEMFTKTAHDLAKVMGYGDEDTTLVSLFTPTLLSATAEKYGIDGPGEGETWESWSNEHPQEFANLLVMATALDNQNATNGTEGYTPAASTNLIMDFSIFYAFAATCPKFSEYLDDHMAELDSVTDADTGEAWYKELEAEAKKDIYKNTNNQTFDQYKTSDDAVAEKDKYAFSQIMAALNNTTADDIADDWDNANLFTTGTVKGVYDQYMNTMSALAGGTDWDLTLNLQKGQIAIIFNQNTFTVIATIDN